MIENDPVQTIYEPCMSALRNCSGCIVSLEGVAFGESVAGERWWVSSAGGVLGEGGAQWSGDVVAARTAGDRVLRNRS